VIPSLAANHEIKARIYNMNRNDFDVVNAGKVSFSAGTGGQINAAFDLGDRVFKQKYNLKYVNGNGFCVFKNMRNKSIFSLYKTTKNKIQFYLLKIYLVESLTLTSLSNFN
jgi:hypothetical protein